MKESKRDKILSYLNMLPYYREKEEGVDYSLQYIPGYGWYIKEESNPSINTFLGKSFASIERQAEKAIFTWQVFGENTELFNTENERSND